MKDSMFYPSNILVYGHPIFCLFQIKTIIFIMWRTKLKNTKKSSQMYLEAVSCIVFSINSYIFPFCLFVKGFPVGSNLFIFGKFTGNISFGTFIGFPLLSYIIVLTAPISLSTYSPIFKSKINLFFPKLFFSKCSIALK